MAQNGFADRQLYTAASARLVGVNRFETFSTARYANGKLESHELPFPEALCNCACWPADNFVYCHNTAKTTVGVSSFAYDPWQRQWIGKALRFFGPQSPGWASGRRETSFLGNARLPDGPGGAMYFDVAYINDQEADTDAAAAARGAAWPAAVLVRGKTSQVDCAAHELCDQQCAGVPQYTAWRASCDNGSFSLSPWRDPWEGVEGGDGDAPSNTTTAVVASALVIAAVVVAARPVWRYITRRMRGPSSVRDALPTAFAASDAPAMDDL